jgi:hypothetical protein
MLTADKVLELVIRLDGEWDLLASRSDCTERALNRTGLVSFLIWHSGSTARLPGTPKTPRSVAAHFLYV